MAEIVNLRLARKARQRREREAAADTSRALHGLTRTERRKLEAERRLEEERLEGHHRSERTEER